MMCLCSFTIIINRLAQNRHRMGRIFLLIIVNPSNHITMPTLTGGLSSDIKPESSLVADLNLIFCRF